MDNNASIPKERRGVGYSREEEVAIADLEAGSAESRSVNFAMLASEVADLASRGLLWACTRACVGVCYVVRVEMATSCCTIAVFRDWVDVDVIGFKWSATEDTVGRIGLRAHTIGTDRRSGKVEEVYVEVDACAILCRDAGDGSLDWF